MYGRHLCLALDESQHETGLTAASWSPAPRSTTGLHCTPSLPRYSNKYPFRLRSETPEIAIELSLQVRGLQGRAQQRVHLRFICELECGWQPIHRRLMGPPPQAHPYAPARSRAPSAPTSLPVDAPPPTHAPPPQPWRAFKPDGVIFFSDILTPLPALGIEFDVIKGKGPQIETPLRGMDQVRTRVHAGTPWTLHTRSQAAAPLCWGAGVPAMHTNNEHMSSTCPAAAPTPPLLPHPLPLA